MRWDDTVNVGGFAHPLGGDGDAYDLAVVRARARERIPRMLGKRRALEKCGLVVFPTG